MQSLRVAAVRVEATDIVSLDLVPVSGGLIPQPEAGAHLRLTLGDRLVRQYTLCNGPGDTTHYRIAVKRESVSRGGSAAVHALRVNDRVGFDGPFNQFPVDWSHRHLILIGAGIGITPILSMALSAAQRAHSFEVHYFAQSTAHAAFQQLLEERAGRHLRLHLGLTPEAVQVALSTVTAAAPPGSALYVCGPSKFMDLAMSMANGQPNIAAVCSESFGTASDASWTKGQAPDVAKAFLVRLARSGGEYEVPPERSILEVLESAGVDVLCSCRDGVCGMCVTEVVEGEPDHRDEFLSEASKAEGQLMAICVSRSRRGLLVLDL